MKVSTNKRLAFAILLFATFTLVRQTSILPPKRLTRPVDDWEQWGVEEVILWAKQKSHLGLQEESIIRQRHLRGQQLKSLTDATLQQWGLSVASSSSLLRARDGLVSHSADHPGSAPHPVPEQDQAPETRVQSNMTHQDGYVPMLEQQLKETQAKLKHLQDQAQHQPTQQDNPEVVDRANEPISPPPISIDPPPVAEASKAAAVTAPVANDVAYQSAPFSSGIKQLAPFSTEHALEVSMSVFVTIRIVRSGAGTDNLQDFLAVIPGATSSGLASMTQRIWRIVKPPKPSDGAGVKVALQCHLRTYLSAEGSGLLAVDRPEPRGYETWSVVFEPGHSRAYFRGHKMTENRYLNLDPHGMLKAGARDTAGALQFEIAPVDCSSEEACWGVAPFSTAAVSSGASLSPSNMPPRIIPVVLFGTPKDVSSGNHQVVENQRRAFEIWSAMPHVVAATFTKDEEAAKLARTYNITAITDFEVNPQFPGFPTYRGLFNAAFQLHPESDVVAYSNGDMLYTSGLIETIVETVQQIGKFQTAGTGPRFMIIGRRTNFDIPIDHKFSKEWENEINTMARSTRMFDSNAEDFFVVSRALWESLTIPSFVVGGVAFDNWLVSLVNRSPGVIAIDGSNTVVALHQNHGFVKASRRHPASPYNTDLAIRHGSWSNGRTVDTKFMTTRLPSGKIVLHERHPRLTWPADDT